MAAARDALRRAEEAHRGAEVRELEARLALDAVREQALVEFAGLGVVGLRALDPAAAVDADEDEGAALAAALGGRGRAWAASPPAVEPPPSGRLASLRRRFHELGAANPFAADEHAELRARVDGLEAQRADLGGRHRRRRAGSSPSSTRSSPASSGRPSPRSRRPSTAASSSCSGAGSRA